MFYKVLHYFLQIKLYSIRNKEGNEFRIRFKIEFGNRNGDGNRHGNGYGNGYEDRYKDIFLYKSLI
jgi:hypothetical protein